jgi:DNA end-binding protein Ku
VAKSRERAREPSEPAAAEPESDEDGGSSARAFWSGTLSFGLVSIPVDLYRGTRPSGISLRMLTADGSPLARRYVCSSEGIELEPADLVRGYEIRPGEHVPISDEELEALEPEKSRDIDLRRFVPAESIDPMFLDRPFFLAPSGDSSKAYRLLAETMERVKRVGIASFVMQGKEHAVAILADSGILRAQLLRFASEVRTSEQIGLPPKREVPRALVEAFRKVIGQHTRKELDSEALRDEGVERVRALLEDKERKHHDVVEHAAAEGEPADARIIDLMEVLKRSLTKAAPKSKARRAR